MSTMDDIIRKTKELGVTATKKTEAIAEELKLKVKLSEIRSQINEKYALIGEAYYTSNKNGTDMECSDTVNELDELYEKQIELENKLIEIKGVKKCPQCGSDAPSKAEYCQKCGCKL